jgi:SagB-type dehydrogenase family enzyme
MEIRRLPEPCLRDKPLECQPLKFRVAGAHYLPSPNELPADSFFSVIARRRSRREFGRLSEEALSDLLWYCSKIHEMDRSRLGPVWQHRGTPSGGGCHPIDVVILQPNDGGITCELYDPIAHALNTLVLPTGVSCESLRETIAEILDPQGGSVLLFVANFAKTLTRYEGGESLVWRDAGCLLATVSLAAEALSLNCCALGFNGDSLVTRLFGIGTLAGVGGCIVGSHPEKSTNG